MINTQCTHNAVHIWLLSLVLLLKAAEILGGFA